MKTTNKISSFIGGLVIAFAITLFMPSALQAKWGNYGGGSSSSSKGNSCSSGKNPITWAKGSSSSSKGNSSSSGKNDLKKCYTYKKLAAKCLKTYYKCYNYKYYKKYLYYMKKYKQCQANVTPECDKYKSLADKYLAAYNKCGYYCYYRYYQYYLNLYKKCEANLDKTGKVCGSVFEDTNGNGVQDAGEPNYAGAKVNITDETAVTVTATTDADGKYCQEGIEEGVATVVVDPASLPAGATITTENPTSITVVAEQANPAGADGFEPASTVGKVCGSVFEDTNGNGVQDAGEPNYAGAKVNITDETAVTVTATTDADGKYCQEGIEEGVATVVVDPASLPAGATITTENPTSITVVADQANPAGADGFEPLKTGSVTGLVYQDFFSDADYNPNDSDSPIANVPVTLTVNGETFTTTTDANGKYLFEDIPVGDATITIDEDFITNQYPNAEQTAGVNPSTVTVLENVLTDAGEDGYNYRTCGFIRGVVYIDKNNNGSLDGHDLRLEDIRVNLQIEGHDTPSVVRTDSIGIWYACIHKPQGTKVTINVNKDDIIAKYGNITQKIGLNPNDVNINIGFLTDAGEDGFVTTDP